MPVCSIDVQFGIAEGKVEKATYTVLPIVVNKGAVTASGESIGVLEIENRMDAKKVNTIVWAIIVGSILYGVIRLLTRKRIIVLLKPLTNRVDATLMDEISYRAVVIGFPLFA